MYDIKYSDLYPWMPSGLDEWQEEEWICCMKDPVYFLTRYGYIEVKSTAQGTYGGMRKLEMWDSQKDLIRMYQDGKLHVILKARQLGISWITGLYALHHVMFFPHTHVLIESRKEVDAQDLLSKIMMAYDKLPVWLRGPIAEDTKSVKQFGEKVKDPITGDKVVRGLCSKLEAIATGGGASKTVTMNIRDEAALVDDKIASATHKATIPTLTASNGWCLIISTAEGAYGWFYNMYWGAREGTNDFKAHFLGWDARPDRDAAWKEREMRKFSNEDDFRNQYPSSDAEAFLVSGRTVFSRRCLEAMQRDEFPEGRRIADPYLCNVEGHYEGRKLVSEAVASPGGYMEVWHRVVPGFSYVAGVDVSEGKMVNPDAPTSKRADFSVCEIICMDTMEQVARIKTNEVPPNEFALIVAQACEYYNNALAVPEVNSGYGFAFMQSFKGIYDNIFYRHGSEDSIRNIRARQYGFLSTETTKGQWIASLGALIKDSVVPDEERMYPSVPRLIIHASDTIKDLTKFVYNDRGKAGAAIGEHDDDVVALGLCAYAIMSEEWGIIKFETVELNMKPVFTSWHDVVSEHEKQKICEHIDNMVDTGKKKRYNRFSRIEKDRRMRKVVNSIRF